MKTITAKELRDNLDKVVARARAGESIRVTYRSKPAFTITAEPVEKSGPEPGSREAMQLFLKRLNARKKHTGQPALDANKSYKEIYWEDMAKKYDIEQ